MYSQHTIIIRDCAQSTLTLARNSFLTVHKTLHSIYSKSEALLLWFGCSAASYWIVCSHIKIWQKPDYSMQGAYFKPIIISEDGVIIMMRLPQWKGRSRRQWDPPRIIIKARRVPSTVLNLQVSQTYMYTVPTIGISQNLAYTSLFSSFSL